MWRRAVGGAGAGAVGVCLAAVALAALSPAAIAAERDAHGWFRHTCSAPTPARASCEAEVATDADGAPLYNGTSPLPGALPPAAISAAYGLRTLSPNSAETVAIVDAYNDPAIFSDLATFDSQYAIPNLTQGAPGCTLAAGTDGCFEAVSETGTGTLPQPNASWAGEISLDVETVHAICWNCNIILVEATTSLSADLYAAEDEAVSLGANVVTDSWGVPEYAGEANAGAFFDHPGVAIAVSAGDSGYGPTFPATSPYVIAVGGTTLTVNGNGSTISYSYGGETVWGNGQAGADGDGTASGCSAYESKPIWQTDSGCANRTDNDVSADADPATGISIYDSVAYEGASGWLQYGGTSLAAQIIGGAYGLTGQTTQADGALAAYYNASQLNPVTSGSNGSCSPTYLCTGGPGYNGPAGLGSPDGIGAFLMPAPTVGSPSPASAVAGTAVTLTGTYLLGTSAVDFNGTPAQFTVQSATQITATVPAGASSGAVSVTTSGGTATGSTFTVIPNPSVHAVISASTQTVTVGSQLSYAVTLTNDGGASTSTTLTATLPTQVALQSATASGGASCSASGETVTCPLGAFAAGASSTEMFTVTVNAGGTLTLATSTTSSPADANPANSALSYAVQAVEPSPPTSLTTTSSGSSGTGTPSASRTPTAATPAPITLSALSATSLSKRRPELHLTVRLRSAGATEIELLGARGKLLARWSMRLGAGVHHLTLVLPSAARHAGRDRVRVSQDGAAPVVAAVTLRK